MTVDLGELFRLDVGMLELVIRTSVVYCSLIAVLRILARREMGSFELPDLLLIVLVADGMQNGMAGEYRSVTGALVVAGTLFGWNYLLDYLTYRSAFARKILQPSPLILVKDGQINRRNMRRELVSKEELMSELRAYNVDDIAQVALARLEHNGILTVRKREQAGGQDNVRQTSAQHGGHGSR